MLDNFLIPIALQELILTAWTRGHIAYYFCHLYNENSTDSQNKLSIALYNIFTKEPDLAVYDLKKSERTRKAGGLVVVSSPKGCQCLSSM